MVAGVSSKYIVNDYSMSNNAYECLADKYALVAALSQRELDGEMCKDFLNINFCFCYTVLVTCMTFGL